MVFGTSLNKGCSCLIAIGLALTLMSSTSTGKISVALVTHVWTPFIQAVFDRLRQEAPADHDIWFLLSAPKPDVPAELDTSLVHVSREDLFRMPYPVKCEPDKWAIEGNLDLVFLEFRRRLPKYDQYWFVEYDVHYEGDWGRFFNHFRESGAGTLATTLAYCNTLPGKLELLCYPRLALHNSISWKTEDLIKGFLPICRISAEVLDLLDGEYRAGLGGHYELTIPTVAHQAGLGVEDIGGDGPFVHETNRNRFYFSTGSSYTHSPGNFVFRPTITRVLARKNTLWHPVKAAGMPMWHSNRPEGNWARNLRELAKIPIGRAWIWWWFATRWRPLR